MYIFVDYKFYQNILYAECEIADSSEYVVAESDCCLTFRMQDVLMINSSVSNVRSTRNT